MNLRIQSPRLALLGFFLCLLGAKLFLIGYHGSFIPYWDQWEAEAAQLYHPLENGHLRFMDLLAAHNEHRILWTRLAGLLAYRLNGGIWDPQLQMVLGVGFHGLSLVLLLGGLRREMPRDLFPPLLLFSLTLLIPFGAENALWGFQSQFYFLLLFGLAGICGTTSSRPLGSGWWLGFLAVVAAFFSVASGFLAGAAIAACHALQMIAQRRWSWRHGAAIGLLLAAVLAAWAFTPVVAGHAHFKATGLRDFILTLAQALAFPFYETPAMALFMQAPVAGLLAWAFLIRRPPHRASIPWFLVGAAFYVWLNAAATAYGRGAGAPPPESRYMDNLFIGLVLNAAALLHLSSLSRNRWLNRTAAVWSAVALLGLSGVYWTHTRKIIQRAAQMRRVEAFHALQFLADFDRRHIVDLPVNAIPHPSGERLAYLLENETVRSFLPTPLRNALPARQTNIWFFLERGAPPDMPPRPFERVWGSYGPGGLALTGELALDFDRPRKGGFLEIAVAGDVGTEGEELSLENLEGQILSRLAPRHPPGNQWRSVYVRSPREPFRIVARDSSTERWLAFAAPKEIGPGTLFTRTILFSWGVFLGLGIMMLIASIMPLPKSRIASAAGRPAMPAGRRRL